MLLYPPTFLRWGLGATAMFAVRSLSELFDDVGWLSLDEGFLLLGAVAFA